MRVGRGSPCVPVVIEYAVNRWFLEEGSVTGELVRGFGWPEG